jgi:hypothetical protein
MPSSVSLWEAYWTLIKIILILFCQLIDIIESQFRPSDELNAIQFIRSNKITQFSIKRSYGFWLWGHLSDIFNLTKDFHPSNSLQPSRNYFLELKVSNEIQSLFVEIQATFLRKLFSKNSFMNWSRGVTTDSLQLITVAVDQSMDLVRAVVPSCLFLPLLCSQNC